MTDVMSKSAAVLSSIANTTKSTDELEDGELTDSVPFLLPAPRLWAAKHLKY